MYDADLEIFTAQCKYATAGDKTFILLRNYNNHKFHER